MNTFLLTWYLLQWYYLCGAELTGKRFWALVLWAMSQKICNVTIEFCWGYFWIFHVELNRNILIESNKIDPNLLNIINTIIISRDVKGKLIKSYLNSSFAMAGWVILLITIIKKLTACYFIGELLSVSCVAKRFLLFSEHALH